MVLILSWIIIPLAQDFESAGDFEPKLRFKRALKNYIISTIIGVVTLIVCIIYLIFIKKSFTMYTIINYPYNLLN